VETVTTFLSSLIFVVLAEMGDKTQLLAMCFAARYRWQTVMWGVFVATAANHLLAVVAGNYITQFVPMNYISIAAGVSFIIFGLWTIRGDTLDCDTKPSRFGPFWTVAIAFFIAEMGDKTQLATAALAAEYRTIVPVWLGTTAGMLVADAIGIIFGVVMGKKIPDRLIKWVAAMIFIAFGAAGVYRSAPAGFWTAPLVAGSMLVIALLVAAVVFMNRRAADEGADAASG
jgi:Ca2+/H+ antiporter, TMEM165/GDT1 family